MQAQVLGPAPAWMTLGQAECWAEFAREIPWLTAASRTLLSVAVVIRAKLQTGQTPSVSELQLLRHRLFTRILGGIPVSALADGLTMKTAVDTAWAIASPESYDLLVRRLGYRLDDFRDWMRQNLTTALLAP